MDHLSSVETKHGAQGVWVKVSPFLISEQFLPKTILRNCRKHTAVQTHVDTVDNEGK